MMNFRSDSTPMIITMMRTICLAGIQRQHIDQIQNENNNQKGDEYADKHECPLLNPLIKKRCNLL